MAKGKFGTKKQNIELRFFTDYPTAKFLLKRWKDEGFNFDPYSFTDFYFKNERSSKKLAKIRKWKKPKRPIEIIFFFRSKGIKVEERVRMKTFREAIKYLEKLGFESYLKIEKKKAWMVEKGEKAYAFEFIPELGWTGEVEIPVGKNKILKQEISELKSLGIKNFSFSSLLEAMEKKKGIKVQNKPKIYKYKLLKI